MDEETTTTHVPIEQPLPTLRRRLVLVGIVLTTVGIVYVLYRLLKPSSPQVAVPSNKMVRVQQKMQIKTPLDYRVFRQQVQTQIKNLRNMKK